MPSRNTIEVSYAVISRVPRAHCVTRLLRRASQSSARLPVLAVWLRDLVISLAISAFIIIFLYQPVKVEGTSMMPSLDDQERIFVNKFVYRWEPIERGDIVVFRYPRDPSKSYIKRVIGVAGDRHPHRCRPGVRERRGHSKKTTFRPLTPTSVPIRRSSCQRTATSCWAIIAACRTTAATLGR